MPNPPCGPALKVSVVVPAFQVATFLREALESVWTQTRRPDEVLVVDDASTDATSEVARAGGAIVLRHEVNRGGAAARNTGWRAATGDVVAWLDGDDRWRPRHLEVVVGLLERTPEADMAFAATQRFDMRDDLIMGYVPLDGRPHHVLQEAFRDWLHTTIGSAVRRRALEDVGGFDEAERAAVDFDLWLRLARHHLAIASAEVTSEWRMHPAQMSNLSATQYAAAYRARLRMLAVLRATGEHGSADALELQLPEIWSRDVRYALAERDEGRLRGLTSDEGTLATLPPRARVGAWALRRLPRPAALTVHRRTAPRERPHPPREQ